MNHLILLMAVMAFWLGPAAMAHAGQSLPDRLQHTRFVSYTPRGFSIVNGKVLAPTKRGIQEDLTLLRPYFSGLITYASTNGVEAVAKVANDLGYQAVIMGVWEPRSEAELHNVITAAKAYPAMVAAVVIGNEGLYTKRYTAGDVEQARQRLKQACPWLAVTTSEPFFLYFKEEHAAFFKSHDLLLPNVHPLFEKWFTPSQAAQGAAMVVSVAEQFAKTYTQPLLIKETGLPSGRPERGFSPEVQALFWAELGKRFPVTGKQSFACFEAFDAPWKPKEIALDFPGEHGNEAFWGFFTADGIAKPVLKALPRLNP